MTAVPAIVYQVNGLQLTRNGVVLSNSVEDLQVQFWVDAQVQDETIGGNEWPVVDLNANYGWPMDLTRIRRVQLTVVTRGTQGEQQEGQQFNRRRRPAVSNRIAGAFDDFPRRSFTIDVLPRNLL